MSTPKEYAQNKLIKSFSHHPVEASTFSFSTKEEKWGPPPHILRIKIPRNEMLEESHCVKVAKFSNSAEGFHDRVGHRAIYVHIIGFR